ncbi:hypothetical protein GW17_00057092 [Ensete ventricosum]|nr:hypothetical protein GW17_00057092 [Ensete ventricosum]
MKIAESERLQVDVGVLGQGTKYAVCTIPFLLRGVGDKGDGEDGTIPEETRTIKDLLQVGGLRVVVTFLLFSGKTSCIPKV